jgi:hypothetical protein
MLEVQHSALAYSMLASSRPDIRLSSNEQDARSESEATMLHLRPWRCPDRYAGVELSQAFLEEVILT